MGLKEEKRNIDLENLVLKKKSKNYSCTSKPVFSEDGKSIIMCHGKSCHMYNTSTGNHVKELFQCSHNIISHQLHPLEQYLLIAISENGEVTVFNLKTDQIDHSVLLILNENLLTAKNIPKFSSENEEEVIDWKCQSVNSISHRRFLYAEVKPYQGNPSKILVWASWCLNEEIEAHISVFSLSEGEHKSSFSFRKSRLKKAYGNFALSKYQELDVFVGLSNHCVHVAFFDNKKSYYYSIRKHYTGLNNTLSCVAFHPTENCFATGDSIGRIIIWKNIFDKYPLKEILHWHCMPVCDLIFTKSGNYIFSGGEENVLVKWSTVSRKKQFLPRLSGGLCYLSQAPDTSLLSVLTSDSKLLVLDFNFQSVSVIQNFSKWCLLHKNGKHCKILSVDPRSDCVVLNGKTGHIQFLSLKDDGKLMYTFDVTNRNFITPHVSCAVSNTEVTHALFSSTGEWMVTAESRKDKGCSECRLKFWKYVEEQGSFALNTNVEFPHEGDEIYSLEMSLDGVLGTTGPNKKFRLWALDEYQVGNSVREIWSVYRDRKYRHLPCYALDFSNDSSLVAVTFGSIATVWEKNSCLLKCSLSLPNSKETLKTCKFGNNELTHLLVTGTDYGICCWNTITLSLLWMVPFKLELLASDSFSVYMTAFSKDNALIVFNPASPVPELLMNNVCDSRAIAAKNTLSHSGKFSLLFLTENQDLFSLDDAEEVREMPSDGGTATNVTPYALQTPQVENTPEHSRKKLVSTVKNNQQFVSSVLNGSAHTLSNPSLLSSQVLRGLLLHSLGKSSAISRGPKMSQKVMDFSDVHPDAAKSNDFNECKLQEFVKTMFSFDSPHTFQLL